MHEIGTVRTSLVFRELRHIEIPWRNHCAWFDHTGYSAARARMDAGRVTACAVRLFACLACPAAVRRRSDADRGRHVSVLLALERLPHCARLPRPSARRAVRQATRQGGRVVALAAPQLGSLAEEGTFGLRVVPHAVELRDAGRPTHTPARHRGLGLDDAPLAACAGLGVEAGPVGRPRRRPAAGREARPHPAHAGNPGKTGRGAVCRRARHSPAAQGRLSMDAPGGDGPTRDARTEPETLPGRGAGAEDRADGVLPGHPQFELLFLPTYCPKANPIERAFGDVHDKCTRNHQRKRIADLVWDVEQHLSTNGPWKYKLAQLYYTPEVAAAVERITKQQQLQQAA